MQSANKRNFSRHDYPAIGLIRFHPRLTKTTIGLAPKFFREMKTVIEKSRLKPREAKTVTGKTCPSFGEQKTVTVLNQKNRRRQKTYIGFAQKFSRHGFPVTVLIRT